jgi:putative hydrolase of the HAD superfamily
MRSTPYTGRFVSRKCTAIMTTSLPVVYVRGRDSNHVNRPSLHDSGFEQPAADAVFAIQGVLFDLDNTLFDRDRTFLGWAQQFVREHMGITEAEPARTLIDLLVALDANGYGPKEVLFQRLKERYPQVVEDVHTLTAMFFENHLAYVSLEDRTQDLLAQLHRHSVPWGIVTNGSRNQLLKIQRLGFDQLIRCVFVSEVEGIRKPDRRIFLRAAQCLGVLPEMILFVGDNPEADIVGAKAAGMCTAWLHRGQTWPSSLSTQTPDLVLDSLACLVLETSKG